MTRSRLTAAPRKPPRWATVTTTVGLLLAASACDPGEPSAEEPQREGYDAELAEQMSAHLAETSAEVLTEALLDAEHTTFTPHEAAYLQQWEIYRVSNNADVHARFWDVATSEQHTIPLNGAPDAFDAVLQTDPGRIDTEDLAETAARDYLTLTAPRTEDATIDILESAEDIELGAMFEDEALPAVDEEFADVVQPPKVEVDGAGGYTVTAHVQSGWELHHRTVTFAADGSVAEDSETLAEDLSDL